MVEKSTKEKIFEAAVDLFESKGYHGTSVRDIAKVVGIKESSLYNHYNGKITILDAILEFYMESIHKALPTREEMDEPKKTDDPVEIWVTGVMEFAKKLPPISEKISKILTNEMYLNEKCRKFVLNTLLEEQKKSTEYLLRDLQINGYLKECDIKAEADQYVYMMHGLIMENRLLAMEGKSIEEIQKRLIKEMTVFISRLKN